VLVVESDVALDLGCKYCARVYLAILGRGGTSWLEQIIRDTGMRKLAKTRYYEKCGKRLVRTI